MMSLFDNDDTGVMTKLARNRSIPLRWAAGILVLIDDNDASLHNNNGP
jgi:hypothetical protein